MDAVSYSLASKQAQRIEKFIENPDSTSGIVTVPKVIASGESVTIPAGRVAILPDVRVDGDLIIEDGGDVFVPSGAGFNDLDQRINTLGNITDYVNNMAELKAFTNKSIKSLNVLGYYSKGDGGGGTFYWDATSTEPDNHSTIIQANGITTGRWIKNRNITNENNSSINPMKMNDSNSYNTKLLNRIGQGSGNVMQGFCIDKKNNSLYTTHISPTVVDGEEWAMINKFRNDSALESTATHSTAPSDVIGHQGLSIQYFNDEIRFWASANYKITDSGTKAIRFKIDDSIEGAGNSIVTDTEEFKLFPGTGTGSSTPAVSSCGRYLIVEKSNIIRVFDINIFTTAGDYSDKCIYEFTVPSYLAMQGLACDGNFIYILQGYSNPNENVHLSTYTLDGKLVSKNTNFDVGLTNSLQDGDGLHHEPEGLCIANINGVDSLLMIVSSGNEGNRYARVYDCGNRDRYENYASPDLGNYHQIKYLEGIPGGDTGFDAGYKYFLLCPWVGVENKIVGKLYAGRHSTVTSHGRNFVIDITSRYSTSSVGRETNYSIQSTTDRDTFSLVKVTYNGIEYLAIKPTDNGEPIFRAGIVFSGFEGGCIFKWVNESDISNEEAAPTSGYNNFSNEIKASNLFSGTYLPVITNGVGVSSSTPYSVHYVRCGKEVFVAGGFNITTNVNGTEALFECSLPIPSDLSAGRFCTGSFGSSGNATYSNCTISGNAETNRASFRCIPSVAGNITIYFAFQYSII